MGARDRPTTDWSFNNRLDTQGALSRKRPAPTHWQKRKVGQLQNQKLDAQGTASPGTTAFAHRERSIPENKSAFQRVRFCLHTKQPASIAQQAQAAIKNEAEILKCEHHGLAHLTRCPLPQGEGGPSSRAADFLHFASVEKGLRGLQPPYLMARTVLAAVHLQPVMSEKQRVPHPTAINPARRRAGFFMEQSNVLQRKSMPRCGEARSLA